MVLVMVFNHNPKISPEKKSMIYVAFCAHRQDTTTPCDCVNVPTERVKPAHTSTYNCRTYRITTSYAAAQ